MPPPPQPPSPPYSSLQVPPPSSREQPQRRQQRKRGQPRHARRPPRQSRPDSSSGGGGGGGGGSDSSDHDGDGDHGDHDDDGDDDDSTNDGYSSHPSIYSASPVGSDSDRDARARALVQAQVHAQAAAAHKLAPAAAAAAGGIFEQDVEPQGPSPLIGRRPRRGTACAGSGTGTGTGTLPHVPGVGVLETICERKSTDGDEMACDADGGFSTDEDGVGDRGGDEDGFTTDDDDDDDDYGDDDDDDEFPAHGPGYGRALYYEYASPTQPLHPARALSMSARGSLSPSLPSTRHTIHPGLPMPAGHRLTGQHRNHSTAVPSGLLLRPATAAPAAEEHTRHPHLLLALAHALAHAFAPAAAESAARVPPAAPAAAARLPPAHQLAPVLRRADGPSLPPRPLGRAGVWGRRFFRRQRQRDARRAR